MPDTPVLVVETLEIDKKFRRIKDSYVEGNISESMFKVVSKNELKACSPNDILCKCVVLNSDNGMFLLCCYQNSNVIRNKQHY